LRLHFGRRPVLSLLSLLPLRRILELIPLDSFFRFCLIALIRRSFSGQGHITTAFFALCFFFFFSLTSANSPSLHRPPIFGSPSRTSLGYPWSLRLLPILFTRLTRKFVSTSFYFFLFPRLAGRFSLNRSQRSLSYFRADFFAGALPSLRSSLRRILPPNKPDERMFSARGFFPFSMAFCLLV